MTTRTFTTKSGTTFEWEETKETVKEVWSKSLNQKVTEVQVQFQNENPSWIPLETLLAIQSVRNEND